MRTSIVSLTLMTGLCVFATNGSATTTTVYCPAVSTIQCKAPVSVSGLYKTTCSSGEWEGSIDSGDDKIPTFDGDPAASEDSPVCNYHKKSTTTNEYIALLNVSLQGKGCKATRDLKGFNCSGS